jgi:hypothetical protein
MPRFVLLRHDPAPGSSRPLHWDFMLETETGLLTWAVERAWEAGQELPAVQLPLHRAHYLDYEGILSGGRGSVTRLDTGSFTWLSQEDAELVVRLAGTRLRGEVRLVRQLPAAAAADDQRWWISFSTEVRSDVR